MQVGTPAGSAALVTQPPEIGLLDEVSLYRRALAPAEIRAIVQAGAAGKCP